MDHSCNCIRNTSACGSFKLQKWAKVDFTTVIILASSFSWERVELYATKLEYYIQMNGANPTVKINSQAATCFIKYSLPDLTPEDMDGPSLDLEDEWEVVNDEGFVYKRRKRNHVSSTPNPSKIIMNHDDDQYVKQRHQIKKSALLNLKAKYVEEIREWESLFQMLQRTPTSAILSMKETALSPPSLHQTQTENSCKHVLGELLQQAEAQEAILQDATTLCSFAERMCDVYKEDLKQPTFDLPVWGTPTTLLHNLCPSDSEDNG